jgi:putative endonuclease
MTSKRELGAEGEAMAVAHLERNGYAIIERNVRLRRGELDIVARQGGDLVFIEVKSRSGMGYGTPAEAVTPAKSRALAHAAREYLYANLLSSENVRCDIVSVYFDRNAEEPSVDVLRDAVPLGTTGGVRPGA